jgi:two-component system, NtrC family, response regulator AtoC
MVRGESGTGKELVAQAIHAHSQREAGPFIGVNSAALPDALLESELFGHERGAFTGATATKPGRVELAEGGTLFLDEIGDVSPALQVKLLRLIQERQYERLGGTRALHADVRLVAATHRDLEDMVRRGTFREDLFYRLNVITLWLPPLRARRDDIAELTRHYLLQLRTENRRPALEMEPAAVRLLQTQRWPGNVRQLFNFVERLVVLSPRDLITEQDVRRELSEHADFLTQASSSGSVGSESLVTPSAAASDAPAEPLQLASDVRPLREDLRRAERQALTKALRSAQGNRALAARMLGISRRTLYTKLEEHELD